MFFLAFVVFLGGNQKSITLAEMNRIQISFIEKSEVTFLTLMDWTHVSTNGLNSSHFFFNLKNSSTLPETNSSHLKMDGWNTRTFPFGARPIFRGYKYVSFREGDSFQNLGVTPPISMETKILDFDREQRREHDRLSNVPNMFPHVCGGF